MTNVYSTFVQAAFNINADSEALEIGNAGVGVTIKIRKIRVTHSDGTDTTTADHHTKVKLVTFSAGGTGGGGTIVPLDQNAPTPLAAVTVGPMIGGNIGTIDKTIDILSLHSGTDFYWQAADDDDMIVIKPNGIFGVILRPSG